MAPQLLWTNGRQWVQYLDRRFMLALPIDVTQSTGRVLCCTIFRACGKKLLAKGHVISEEDVSMLQTEGIHEVCVIELEEGEIGEDEAVMEVATKISCGSLEIRLAAGGRANLMATQPSCTLIDDELLKQTNYTASIVIATTLNFSYATAGQRICTVKSTPYAVAKSQLEAVISMVKERGPILQARPLRTPVVGILYTDPVSCDRARLLFENFMYQRLKRLGTTAKYAFASLEEEGAVARSLQHLLWAKPTSI